MNKVFKVIALVVSLVLANPAYTWAVVDRSWYGDISAEMRLTGDSTLTVNVIGALTFATAGVTVANPWVRADGYLQIVYSATYNASYVGLRIVSKNGEISEDPATPAVIGRTAVGRIVPSLVDSDADGAYDDNSYSGMIFGPDLDSGTTSEDPSKRVALAWQVFVNPEAAITVPTSSIVPERGGTKLEDNSDPASASSVGPWDGAWAYISDVNDDHFNDGVWDSLTRGTTYPVILSGVSETSGGFLAQHPHAAPDPARPGAYLARPADRDIALYVTGRFANTNWGETPTDIPRAYLLPTGRYRTQLYIELIHE